MKFRIVKTKMDLAVQKVSSDKTVRSETVQDTKDFNVQSLTSQARKREQLVSLMLAIKKVFNLMGLDFFKIRHRKRKFKE